MHLPFKLEKDLGRSIISSGRDSFMRYSGFLGPTWCSVLQEIGSRIFAGSLNIRCLEGILEEVRGECLQSQLVSGEF